MLIDVSTMSHPDAFDLVTVGHFAIDTVLSRKITRPKATLGGPPTYVSVAAAKMGAKVSVISKVGNDFTDDYVTWLQDNRVDLSGLKRVSNAATTRFLIEYKNWERQLRLEARAPPVSPVDIPDSLHAKIIHAAPIADEVSGEVVAELRKHTKVLSLDPQGLVRAFDRRGNVSLKQWQDSGVLGQIDVFKASAKEVQAVTRANDLKTAMKQISNYAAKIVIVTRGMDGSSVFFENQFHNIPGCKPDVIIDPTGAGDAYIGAFLAEYARQKDVLWCACAGSAAASFVVEGIGPARFGGKDEVYQRARTIYQKVAGKQR